MTIFSGARRRHLLDVHAAFGRGDEGDAARGAIDQGREVELARDRRAVLDIEAPDHAAVGAALLGDQRIAQHLAGVLGHLFDRAGEPHAALVAGCRFLELALAAPAGVDLRLDHKDGTGQRPRRLFRFLDREGRRALGNRRPQRAKDGLGLVFVDVHAGPCPLPG